MSQDYVTTARSKGIDERKVVMRHALKNALIPVVTVFGAQIMNALDSESKVNFWLIGAALLFFAAFIFLARRFLKQQGY